MPRGTGSCRSCQTLGTSPNLPSLELTTEALNSSRSSAVGNAQTKLFSHDRPQWESQSVRQILRPTFRLSQQLRAAGKAPPYPGTARIMTSDSPAH
jgi:hypothetical protein